MKVDTGYCAFVSEKTYGPDVRYITTCPIGCEEGFENTSIILPEGPLQRCRECGQLVSQCDEATYYESMKEFDVPQGTLPGPQNLPRHIHRSRKILQRIAKTLHKREYEIDLLDVGCSSGAFLVVARDHGFKVAGVEPAPAAAKTARGMELVIYEGQLESLNLAEESYDAITLFEVIEHLKNPVVLLRECKRILRRGGIIVVCTRNAESWTARYMKEAWEYFDMGKHGGHVSFFNPKSVRILAERTGFEISDLRTRNVRFCGRARTSTLKYRVAKTAGEALNGLARLFGKGHDTLVIMRKTSGGGGLR